MSNAQRKARRRRRDHLSTKEDGFCYYTGIPLYYPRTKSERNQMWNDKVLGHFYPSREHLLPASTGGKKIENNIVLCMNIVNSMVGNAPLSVKNELRESFSKIHFFPNMNKRSLRDKIHGIVLTVLDEYRIHSIYPWLWKSVEDPIKRKEVFDMYISLLSKEEIEIDRMYNDSRMTAFV